MQHLIECEGFAGFHVMSIEWEEKVTETAEAASIYLRPKVD